MTDANEINLDCAHEGCPNSIVVKPEHASTYYCPDHVSLIKDEVDAARRGELPKILNCPWCGSPGELAETKHHHRVVCRRTFDCAAKGPVRDTPTEAVLIWNRPERPKNTRPGWGN